MVSFRSLVAGVALVVAPMVAAVTPDEIAQGFKTLTRLSQEIQTPANSINAVNAPLIIVGQGPYPEIIRGFNQIAASATALVGQIRELDEVESEPDSDLVYDSFHQFSTEHVALLKILISKATVLDKAPFIGPHMEGVLTSDASLVDSLSHDLVYHVPSYADELTFDADVLRAALAACIEKYTSFAG